MDENSQVCDNFESVKKYEKAYLNKQKLESNYTQICENLIKDKEKEQINKSIKTNEAGFRRISKSIGNI